ncbi:Uncharacterised protein (plasmid) [Tsukamurella tyrosinosolvens]|uniref:Excreted virulence factor EspC, type VII ESX diderm n=1 Tax=Tsukamurella tyrosinosolvens TaxID=57704 RepID=A0A1H4VGE3_TSUTY|nr:hypothetical protein [Tsukamurella tyrosinosolvens]KXO90984.1 hypothetical protein AXK58_21370 [Tsukamurella tyrosinosolvens]SEC80057.1 hypothetical protein SAMN04489793_3220 [Tsukamurella tyrosinosolvens]VEH90534.1 Uncharacterised protein [Tsukamurella tyrosinosolvens]
MGDNISINDKSTFLAKTQKIRTAIEALQTAASAAGALKTTATAEAKKFTTGDVAPVYESAVAGIGTVGDKVKTAVTAIATGATNCADTADYKFTGITGVDTDGAERIRGL